jgi:hypothetical protein
LKTQRLAAAGWHDGEQVFTRESVAYDRFLTGTKRIETEVALELVSEIEIRRHELQG